MATLSLTSVAVAGDAKTDPKLEEAKQHMAAGSAFYNDPSGHKCEEALTEFQKAYELSNSWKALRAMAICELVLERDDLAIKHYEEVLKSGGSQLDAADRTQIESDVRALKAAIATLSLKTNMGGVRLTATRQPASGLPVTNRYDVGADGASLGLHPGSYTFVASVEGMQDVTWRTEIKNGSTQSKELVFQPVPKDVGGGGGGGGGGPKEQPVEMERPVPITVWIFTGLTGACAITSGTMMGLAKVANDDFTAQNGHASRAELEDLRSDVITKNIVADVFLGATVASAGVTLIFYFTRPEVPVKKDEKAADKVSWAVVPFAGPDAAGAVVTGGF